jgi:DNA-binding CsgD family transcriptional regulator
VEEGLALFREARDKEGIALSLVSLCTVAMSCQRADIPVGTMLEELKSLSAEIEDRRTVGHMLNLEGGVALAQGEREQALELWEGSLKLFRELRDAFGITTCLTNIGLLTLGLSDDEGAATRLRESLCLARDLDHKMIIQYCLTGLGGVAASRRDLISAARLWGAAEIMGEVYGSRFTRASHALIDYEGRLATARSQLDAAKWDGAWAEGRAMSTEQAVEFALDQGPDPGPITRDAHPAGLSAREVEVLRLVATGLSNAEVAEELFLSSRTVDWHLGSVYRKLGIHSRAEATRFALEHDLL